MFPQWYRLFLPLQTRPLALVAFRFILLNFSSASCVLLFARPSSQNTHKAFGESDKTQLQVLFIIFWFSTCNFRLMLWVRKLLLPKQTIGPNQWAKPMLLFPFIFRTQACTCPFRLEINQLIFVEDTSLWRGMAMNENQWILGTPEKCVHIFKTQQQSLKN